MAAAHAACYAMALNGTLGRKGASADRTVVRATVTADKGDAGIKIQSSKLEVTAYGLKGLEASQFAEVARKRKAGVRCRTRIAGRCRSASKRSDRARGGAGVAASEACRMDAG